MFTCMFDFCTYISTWHLIIKKSNEEIFVHICSSPNLFHQNKFYYPLSSWFLKKKEDPCISHVLLCNNSPKT